MKLKKIKKDIKKEYTMAKPKIKKVYKSTKKKIKKFRPRARRISNNIDYYFDESNRQIREFDIGI